jgi:hypothetical protein
MNPKKIAHNAHLQSLRLLNNRELHIDELIKEKNYAEIVNEKRNYQKRNTLAMTYKQERVRKVKYFAACF